MLHSNDKIIKHKVGLLNLAEELGNVAKACKMMGVSRDTFYRYKDAVEENGVGALLDQSRQVPNLKNVSAHSLAYWTYRIFIIFFKTPHYSSPWLASPGQ